MTVFETSEPQCSSSKGSVEQIVRAGAKDLGGFTVRRVLPAPERMTVGPFIFFDEMGPADFTPGEGMNVRPHPHIGLATVTYLFAGTIMHRDSLGFAQPIEPGAINLMTAGRGIVHSERTPPELLASGQFLHGIQTWMALPDDLQEIDPAFKHYAAESLPRLQTRGVENTVIIGSAFGLDSPVAVHARTLYLEQRYAADSICELPRSPDERAVYVIDGALDIGGVSVAPGELAVLGHGDLSLRALGAAHVMIVGGEPIGRRHVKWNFVHASEDRIRSAAQDWAAGRFDRISGDDEFIPLPEHLFG